MRFILDNSWTKLGYTYIGHTRSVREIRMGIFFENHFFFATLGKKGHFRVLK